MPRTMLTDQHWLKLKSIVHNSGIYLKHNLRNFIEAILYRIRIGYPWRDLPERFGDFRVIHTRHSRWAKTGVWKRMFEDLAKDADNEYAMIDSTIVRAHQHSAGAQKKTEKTKR